MLYAFIEGLAGIQDKDKLFRRVRICPKWIIAGVEKAEVCIDYKSSGARVKYEYRQTSDKLVISMNGSFEYLQLSLPVPENYIAGELEVNRKKRKYLTAVINKSPYLIVDADAAGECEVTLMLKKKSPVRK